MIKSIVALENTRKGSDIWILGSGSSLNYVDPSFFNNKIVIAVNSIYKFFRCDYIVLHHHQILVEALNHLVNGYNVPVIASYHGTCNMNNPIITDVVDPDHYDNLFIYGHLQQGFMNTDFSSYGNNTMLVIGGTTVINAISFAVHLGAANIILAGVDGGTINDQCHINGYYDMSADDIKIQVAHSLRTRALIIEYRNFLAMKGINMYSLNPFMNMGYEGNKFINSL